MQEWGAAREDITDIYLAGAFGNYVNFSSARRIGLLDFPLLRNAAAWETLRQRALKIFAIEGGIGLVSLVMMGILAALGYPPKF